MYKVWYDRRTGELTTYSRYWKQADWDNLVFIGELQPSQNRYKQDADGIYRVLYGKKVYYYQFFDYGPVPVHARAHGAKIKEWFFSEKAGPV